MNGITTIYGLTDPRTGVVRYVGKTAQRLRDRLSHHIGLARNENYRRTSVWVRSLLAAGVKPEVVELEAVPTCSWEEAERFWIAYLRMLGAELTNHTPGGAGAPSLDAVARDRKRRAARPRQDTEETRRRKSEGAKNRPPISEATRQRIGAAGRGRVKTAEQRAAIGEWSRGSSRTQKQREKMSGMTYVVTAPDGEEYVVKNLREFCRLHGLHASTLSAIANPDAPVKRHQYRGWRCRRS